MEPSPGDALGQGSSIDLRQAAEAALGRRIASATLTARTPIDYDPYLPGRHVERVTGIAASVDGAHLPWTAVIKRTTGPGLRAARRELAAYRLGIAASEPTTGLRGPVLLASDDGDQYVELWLEDLRDAHGGRWPVSRFGLAARHIASWDARSRTTPMPAGFDSEDAWAERHGQPTRTADALHLLSSYRTPAARETMGRLGDPGFRRTEALIGSTSRRIASLAAFPQSPLHHDLVRSNLFALSSSSTAAIDWENVGRGPLGVDLATLVIGSVRRGEAESDHLEEIERQVLTGYLDGLRESGIDAERDVRLAYRLALGLRWHVVLGTIGAALDPTMTGMRGSRPGESRTEGLRHMMAVARHILDAGDVA